MSLIDFILNIAGLLLWLNWRTLRFDPLRKPAALTLVGTLKRAGSSVSPRWRLFGMLAALLLVRAVVYRLIGPATDWTPHLQLGVVSPAFSSKTLFGMLVYSILGFGLTLAVFFLWLLFLSLLDTGASEPDPIQKLARVHLGRFDHWPLALRLLLPVLIAVLLWLALHPLLVRCEIVPHATSTARVAQQGVLIGVGSFLVWKHLIGGLLLLHLVNHYVYLGDHPVWSFVNAAARKLLSPLRRLPLRYARMDFAPIAGIVVVFLLAEVVAYGLGRLYRN